MLRSVRIRQSIDRYHKATRRRYENSRYRYVRHKGHFQAIHTRQIFESRRCRTQVFIVQFQRQQG